MIVYDKENIDELLNKKINGYIIVTIPADGWTTQTDATGITYYTQEIGVTGMTADYTGGNNKVDYVRPNPFNVNENETLSNLFQSILDIESLNNKIKITMAEIPTKAFQIYLYGVA